MTAEVARPSPVLPQNRHGRPPKTFVPYRVIAAPVEKDTPLERTLAHGNAQVASMPLSTSSPIQATFPSFMSVFGNGPIEQSRDTIPQSPSRLRNTDLKPCPLNYHSTIRRDSASTFESNDSSPTTTISTVDSSLTESSPGSSPESPGSIRTKPSFRSAHSSFDSTQRPMEGKGRFSNSFPSLPGVDHSESPQRKVRNMKNLSVNTSTSNRPATSNLPKLGMTGTSTAQPKHAFSAPPTPAFIVPPKAPRRKPSNLGLTLATPDPGSSSSQDRPPIVPQTPSDSQIQTIRHLQASTEGSLLSPTVAPEGGMRLPPINQSFPSNSYSKAAPPLSISPGSISSPIKKQTLEHVQEEPDYELPLSQEAKSPAYPQGPVCIYDPYLYLYLEPTGIEAREFDVILNVAKEVKNPFDLETEGPPEKKTADKGVQVNFDTVDKGVQASFDTDGRDLAGQDQIIEPQTATSEFSFPSAVETHSDGDSTTAPSTPKPTRAQPEYIHIPWDHNSNVVDDLLRLCDLIEDRVRQKKKILVHCQCGVSRSASLVVAYGIYKNPQLSVQEAYDAVKNRSRWIGPNMNLIYQLSEFKGKLAKSKGLGKQNWQTWRLQIPEGAQSKDMRQPDSRMAMSAVEPHPPSNPISGGPNLSISAPSVSNSSSKSTSLTAPTRVGNVSPGPLSAPPDYEMKPSDVPASEQKKEFEAAEQTEFNDKADIPPLTTNHEPAQATFSPTVRENGNAPVGGIASDLREVARDLNIPGEASLAEASNIEAEAKTEPVESDSLAPPGSWPKEAETPKLTAKPSISDLALGFSSLFSRRQGSQMLPLRQEMPKFTEAPSAPKAFNPILHDDVPPTPSLLSPRATEFMASPFHRTVAGDLAGSSMFEQGLMSPKPVDEDPRSPPPKGEAPITRNISDVL